MTRLGVALLLIQMGDQRGYEQLRELIDSARAGVR